MSSTRRVLVTGASGFIGRRALTPLRERGFEVHGLTRRGRGPSIPAVTWHQADLLEQGSIEALLEAVRPTHVLHLAWVTEHGAFWDSPLNLDWLSRSLELVRAAVELGVERVVFAGTCVEYDVRRAEVQRIPLTEASSSVRPESLYGVCKDALRRVLECLGDELSWAWGRIFFVYGPDEHEARLAPSVIRALLAGRPAGCTHGRQVRDFMDVRDVGAAFAALLEADVRGPVNIGSGVESSIAGVASLIGERIGRPDLIHLGALPERSGDPGYLVPDVGRLREEVGFAPRFDLDRGLGHAIDWWAERLTKEA